jgi:hypothetical protein
MQHQRAAIGRDELITMGVGDELGCACCTAGMKIGGDLVVASEGADGPATLVRFALRR